MYKKLDDGVYIFHESLGVRTVDGWNPEDNDGVIGVLVVEGKHQIVIALEDSPVNLNWSDERKLINRPVDSIKDAAFDFNGEEYCKNLNSPEYPAVYYCLNYKKGDRNWHLPSSGELWMIYCRLEEIQIALSIVGGNKFVIEYDGDPSWYWSSTEYRAMLAWRLYLNDGIFHGWGGKLSCRGKVRPVSNFNQLLKHGNNKCEKRIVRFN